MQNDSNIEASIETTENNDLTKFGYEGHSGNTSKSD